MAISPAAAVERDFPAPREPVPQPPARIRVLTGYFRTHWETLSAPEQQQLQAGWDTRALPLIEDDPDGDPDVRAVTFLYRNSAAAAVILSANAMVHPDTLGACEFEALPDGLWALTWQMPASWEASYRITVHTGTGTPPWRTAADRRGVRLAADAGGPDPRNSVLSTGMSGAATSVLRLPAAPPAPWLATPVPAASAGTSIMGDDSAAGLLPQGRCWAGGRTSGPRHVLGDFVRSLELRRVRDRHTGRMRNVWLYRPRVPLAAPTPLLVLHDGQVWAKYQNLAGTLDAAIDAGILPPLHVAMVDSVDVPTRSRELSGPTGSVDFAACDLIPELRRSLPLSPDPLHTVISGASYGGLAALWQVARFPGTAATALAQSPSLWRYDLDQPLLEAAGRIRVRLQAGCYEPSIHAPARALHAALAESGVDTDFRSVTGGHDWAWWHPWLIRGLAAVLAD
ncbi:enterochelin esterase domain-containing protein [Arthrobacter caoxuetaonis]|uniref:DUF3327 domain-containing protein n=1 Tax=Arthrobacter caoxuetaonis TaxID=2886935 RepID=A0A9X1MDG5_9MICC|nr:alpha/beta hydrolase-fold protein [Arthrobacter caoxuetaonis]MCC3297998.1 DUF3327 domain-containing protein [Arthrobacter caoxuetaonis]USQ57012.1 alpha/beta hydrolase-fold protein [Arthrobacter caoxuetaonis]